LTVRAQFFEALSKFQSELRPDASPQIVLQAIAQTAVTVLGAKCVAVFSLPPGQSYAETLLCDSDGMIFENFLVDLPGGGASSDIATSLAEASSRVHVGRASSANEDGAGTPPPPRAGEGPVLSAGDELEWFVTMVSPRLPGDKRFWVCLEGDNRCV